jgi:hypothetical protein
MSHDFVPLLPIAARGSEPLERRHSGGKDQLTKNHDHEPETGGSTERVVGPFSPWKFCEPDARD